ncbi:DUF3376 domain-containing protein [Streptomyces albidochromogenes]|uniref:DUF3376 domain-containing protein n=1 Tax=Streptomyces albidochromogenes TaxID=329524 RepID=A0ABW6FNN6_9ACTN
MTTEKSAPHARHEIRLALVMNGGVSLAVWMGGVTHELDLLRRASQRAAHPRRRAGEEEREDDLVQGIWGEVLAAAGAQVTIDVVSGTSAGGLNGMLLATAIARGRALPSLRETWERSAALDRLLEAPSRTSVFNGEVFTRDALEAINEIERSDAYLRTPVDLFVTATALDGRDLPHSDSFGNPFDVADHRRLYRFRYGTRFGYEQRDDTRWEFTSEEPDDFSPACTEVLALAARASAGFPAAFPPVSELPLIGHRVRPRHGLGFPASCVMDGGVLNNAPFEPVLEAITGRGVVDSPIRRVLVYVVPSVGMSEPVPPNGECEDNSLVSVALNAVRYPGEANLRSGTEEMLARFRSRAHNVQSDLLARARKNNGLADYLNDSAWNLLGEYRRNRAHGLITEARRHIAGSHSVSSFDMPKDDPEATDRLLSVDKAGFNWVPRWDRGELQGPWDAWRWGLATAERLLQCLSVHLRHSIDAHGVSGQKTLTPAQTALLKGDHLVTEALRKTMAISEALDEQLQTRIGTAGDDSNETLATLLDELYEDLDVPAMLGTLVSSAGMDFVQALTQAGINPGWTAQKAISVCLAIEVVTRVYDTPAKLVQPLPPEFQFLRLSPDAMGPLFNVDSFAELGDRKLYGLRLKHFGAFVDAQWRRSDFVWGRLDAAHHLLSLFNQLTSEQRESFEERLHWAILRAEAPAEGGEAGGEAEEKARALRWMKRHLTHLKKSDRDILNRVARSDDGQGTMRRLVETVLRLLSATPPPGQDDGRVKRVWRTTVNVGRTVFAGTVPAEPPPRLRTRLLRAVTYHLRANTRRARAGDPRQLPSAVWASARRTVGCLAVAAALVLVGASVLITWLVVG